MIVNVLMLISPDMLGLISYFVLLNEKCKLQGFYFGISC